MPGPRNVRTPGSRRRGRSPGRPPGRTRTRWSARRTGTRPSSAASTARRPAGWSAGVRARSASPFWIGRKSTALQMKSLNPPSASMRCHARALVMVASILPRWRTMPSVPEQVHHVRLADRWRSRRGRSLRTPGGSCHACAGSSARRGRPGTRPTRASRTAPASRAQERPTRRRDRRRTAGRCRTSHNVHPRRPLSGAHANARLGQPRPAVDVEGGSIPALSGDLEIDRGRIADAHLYRLLAAGGMSSERHCHIACLVDEQELPVREPGFDGHAQGCLEGARLRLATPPTWMTTR